MALLPDKEKLLRNFLRCANREEKYLYIIELGQRLPELRDEDRSPQNSIQGCQSQVWIVMRQNAQGIIELQGDSDAAIVKGLIAVVFILYDQMTPQDIVNFDVDMGRRINASCSGVQFELLESSGEPLESFINIRCCFHRCKPKLFTLVFDQKSPLL